MLMWWLVRTQDGGRWPAPTETATPNTSGVRASAPKNARRRAWRRVSSFELAATLTAATSLKTFILREMRKNMLIRKVGSIWKLEKVFFFFLNRWRKWPSCHAGVRTRRVVLNFCFHTFTNNTSWIQSPLWRLSNSESAKLSRLYSPFVLVPVVQHPYDEARSYGDDDENN